MRDFFALLLLAAACGNGLRSASNDPEAGPPVRLSDPALPESDARLAELGRQLYFDQRLSSPPGQSCASCHAPSAGFADPDSARPTSKGALRDRFGVRNAPTAAYASFVPELHVEDDTYAGGLFLDGRAATLEEQAKAPFLNPLEMGNSDAAEVMEKVRERPYAHGFAELFGRDALADDDAGYELIAQAIAAFERTSRFEPFSSKYDAFIAGRAQLSAQEQRGCGFFEQSCAACHPASGERALFTDFTYDNIGVPRNPANPFYSLPRELNPQGTAAVDLGLGAVLGDPAEAGKFRVATLRNIARTAPYMHNGVFRTLKEVVHFYNARDAGGFAAPEVPETMNRDELGNLGLTDAEEDDLVAFLGTLTDGYEAR